MTGAQLKDKRLAAGMSRAQLGAMLGIHRNTVQVWESKGDVELPQRDTLALLKIFGK